jgi:hypothetical protein
MDPDSPRSRTREERNTKNLTTLKTKATASLYPFGQTSLILSITRIGNRSSRKYMEQQIGQPYLPRRKKSMLLF